MPWDSGSGGSVAAAAQQFIPPQFSATESVYPSVPPACSSDQSPRHRRRTTSTGSSSESLVRQSVEFESQQLQNQQQQRLGGGMSARTMLFSQQSSFPLSRQPASNGDTFEPTDQTHSGSGKSSSGPIVVTANSPSSAAAVAAAAASAATTLQQPECPIVVKRTHSLKDDRIKRFRSKFANNGGPEPQTQQHQQPQQQQQQQQQKLTRSRPGSLRSGSAATSAPSATPGSASTSVTSVVAKVLPDKKVINKASSSENLSPGSGGGNSAAASDLSSLTSLVQRKRDRSQDSADSSKGSPPRRPAHNRKAPAPPPPPSPGQATPTHSSTGIQSSQASPSLGDTVDESSISIAACKLKPPSGRHRLLPSEENSEPEECRSTDSPVEDQHGSDGGGISVVLGHHRSNSFEFLQDAVQSRTAPKILQPSAIRKISDSSQPHLGDAKTSPYGSSPPKTVSFNPTDEILTYDGPPSRKSHHRQGQTSRNQQSRLGDNALIDIHSSMVDMMEKIVSNQRQFLSRVKEGSISVANYRDNTKNLLAMQTRTIQKILDAIQANEKS